MQSVRSSEPYKKAPSLKHNISELKESKLERKRAKDIRPFQTFRPFNAHLHTPTVQLLHGRISRRLLLEQGVRLCLKDWIKLYPYPFLGAKLGVCSVKEVKMNYAVWFA
jgi:hypothetical protein